MATTVRVVAAKGKNHVNNKSWERRVLADRKFDPEFRSSAHDLESHELAALVLRLTEPCDGVGGC